MRLEKAEQRREQRRLARPLSKLICPDSGQVQEPPGPPLLAKRCRKGGKGNGHCVGWSIGMHGLERLLRARREGIWRRS